MSKPIGIDFGSMHSRVAVFENGRANVISDNTGRSQFPSVVEVTHDEYRACHLTKKDAAQRPNTVYSMDRFKSDANSGAFITLAGKDYSPSEMAAVVLRKMKETAEAYLKEEVTQAIITVPALFNHRQREALAEAGRIAGMEVLQLFDSVDAVAIDYAYQLSKRGEDQDLTIAVYNMGAGTFDIAISDITIEDDVDIREVCVVVQTTFGSMNLGGDNFDAIILKMWEELPFPDSVRNTPELERLLQEQLDIVKPFLFSRSGFNDEFPLNSLQAACPGQNLRLTRATVKQRTEGLVDNSFFLCKEAREDKWAR